MSNPISTSNVQSSLQMYDAASNSFASATEDAEKIQVAAGVFLLQMQLLNNHLNRLCQNNSKQNTYIPLQNAQTNHFVFIDQCLKNIANYKRVELEASFFESKMSTAKDPISLKEFKKICKESLQEILEIVAHDADVKVVSHSFEIDPADIETHQLNAKEYKKKARDYDCVRYAFYVLRDSKAEEFALGKTDQIFKTDTIASELITEFGYFIVNEPQKNDLIVYHDNDKPLHFGVFSDPCTVVSKWGLNPQVFSHPVHVTPYGHSFLIFRKA